MPLELQQSLPTDLQKRFDALEARLWKHETTVAVCGALGSLALSAGLLFLSDRAWDTPPLGRSLITGLGLAGSAGFAWRWANHWVFRRRDIRALATLVQKHHRKLGDRLLGIVELADDKQRPDNVSPALCRAAIRQVSGEALKFDFSIAAPARTATRFRSVLGAVLVVIVIAAVLIPPALRNLAARWAAPFATIPRYTFVALGDLPSEIIVPHGEIFEVICPIRSDSVWKPSGGSARFERQRPVAARLAGPSAIFRLPGQTQRGLLQIRIGDARRLVTIVPTHRPALKEMSARTELPDYLQYPPVEEKIQNGAFNYLEGSRVAFTGTVSRALTEASVSFGPLNAQTLTVEGASFSATPLLPEGVSRLEFTWRDTLGLSGAGSWPLTTQSRRDAPPRVDFVNLPPDLVMLATDVLEAQVVAEDDFGVREIGFVWERESDGSATNAVLLRKESRAAAETAQEKRLPHSFRFSPGVAQIPVDSTVELRTTAIDYFPGRTRVSSGPRRIHVISNEEHAELVRQQLEAALARLEEIARNEESLSAATKALKELPKEKLSGEEAAKKAAEQADRQAQLARQLEQLSRETAATVRDAMRNPEFKEDTLREWARNAQEMQKLSQNSMQQAKQSLQNAQQDAEARPKELAEAQKSEEQAVEKLEDIQKRMNRDVDNLQARTLAERLRLLAGRELKLDSQLQRLVPETIGLRSEELPERLRSSTFGMARDQADRQGDAITLQGEISRFFDRTQRPTYGEVSKAMTDARTGEELDRIRGLIQENVAMEAMDQLTAWAKRMDEWADQLEPKSEAGDSGGKGSGGPNKQEDMTKQLMALLRMRDQEMALQKRTRLLEEQKTVDPGYIPAAKSLQQDQSKIKTQLADLESANKVAVLSSPLLDTALAVGEVEGLLNRPDTGTQTDRAEGRAIDLFSDVINLINEQAKKNSPSPGAAEEAGQEMEFLMQMAQQEGQPGQGRGQMAGQTPGGNSNGGGTGRSSGPPSGEVSGKASGPRKVAQATGEALAVPAEFREALEGYFKAVEQEPARPARNN